jgi:hypothetical protein
MGVAWSFQGSRRMTSARGPRPGRSGNLKSGVLLMYVTDKSDDNISVVQINSELRHAQLELISAHCASHRMGQRFSTEQLARYGQRDVLRKSIETANALNEYYSSIERQLPAQESIAAPAGGLTEDQVSQAIECVSAYLQQQHEYYLVSAVPLSADHQVSMSNYFSSDLLSHVKAVELHGERVPNPPFYEQARALGLLNLPDIAHMNSMTFPNVMVFNEQLTARSLFHALVHAVQFEVLGLERYSELFV